MNVSEGCSIKKVNDYVLELYTLMHEIEGSIEPLLETLAVSRDTSMDKISEKIHDEIIRVTCNSGEVDYNNVSRVVVTQSETDVQDMCKEYGKYFVKDISNEHKIRLYINIAIMVNQFSEDVVESLGIQSGTETSITKMADKLIFKAADLFKHPEACTRSDIVDDIVAHGDADYVIEKYRALIK